MKDFDPRELPCPLCPKQGVATHRVVWVEYDDVSRVYCEPHANEVHSTLSKAQTRVEPIEG